MMNGTFVFVPQDTSTAVVKKSRWDIWRNSKWFQRSKWVAAQALMLLYNFGQYEVVSIHAARYYAYVYVVVTFLYCIYCRCYSLYSATAI